MHAGAPDVAAGFTSQGVIDGTEKNLITKRQQQLEDTAAQIVEIPAGLAEEAMEGAVVFEVGQLCRLNDAGSGSGGRSRGSRRKTGPRRNGSWAE